MTRPLFCQCPRNADELHAIEEAERGGLPYLTYRDRGCKEEPPVPCREHIVVLSREHNRITIGRTAGAGIALEHDAQVSRAHCSLERFGDEWSVIDHNLSRNGSYVNEARIAGSRALVHGDALRVGGTILSVRVPGAIASVSTAPEKPGTLVEVSDAQRRVLEALCAPFQSRDVIESAPTTRELAQQLFLSEVTVKAHLRALYRAFKVEDLPRTKRRAELVSRAFQTGVVRRASSVR